MQTKNHVPLDSSKRATTSSPSHERMRSSSTLQRYPFALQGRRPVMPARVCVTRVRNGAEATRGVGRRPQELRTSRKRHEHRRRDPRRLYGKHLVEERLVVLSVRLERGSRFRMIVVDAVVHHERGEVVLRRASATSGSGCGGTYRHTVTTDPPP